MTDVDRVLANIATFGLRLLARGLKGDAWVVGWSLTGHDHPKATAAGLALAEASQRIPEEWKR